MKEKTNDKVYDVAVIGAGVTGTAISRVLSRYELDCAVLEKEADVSFGVSKANSGIIHAGFHHAADTLKARLEIKGNRMFDELRHELNFPFERCGILVAAFNPEEMRIVEQLYGRGKENRVLGIELCGRERILSLEPKLNGDVIGGLYAPTGGIIEPYRYAFALMESAQENGVDYKTNFEVIRSSKTGEGGFVIESRTLEKIRCRWAVNAAGLYADEVSAIMGGEEFEIVPRKGEEYLLDRNASCHTGPVVFPVPGKSSKGMLVIPTVEGTTMAGPTAMEIRDKEDTSTSSDNFHTIFGSARRLVPVLSEKDLITSFAGLRPVLAGNDFYIGVSSTEPRLVQVAGIQSPGLTASPAIADYVKDLLRSAGLTLKEKKQYKAELNGIKRLRDMTPGEIGSSIADDPAYGEIVCRCENVSEAEIIQAIHKGHRTVDGIKFYTRAGMGRCQGGFCSHRILKILARETGSDVLEINKKGSGAEIVSARMRGGHE